jgi:Ca2+-binding RTX toxin-like protein
MPSINPAAGTTNTVYGTSGDDNVHISKAPGLLGALGLFEVNVNGNVSFMTKNQLEHTDFKLGAGNDTLVVDKNVNATIHAEGGSGNDVMIGGSGTNIFSGGSGDDVLVGGKGNNYFDGGRGDDLLIGGGGVNVMDGGRGDDTIVNTGGINIDNGGRGDDTFVNLGGLNFDNGGPGWDRFLNLGGLNFDKQ